MKTISSNPEDLSKKKENAIKRMTISIPKGLYRLLKIKALDNDETLSSFVVALLRKDLSN